MNERIKKLLVKAILEVGPDDNDNGAKEKTLEKFAELIVEECAEIAKKEQAFNARYTDAHLHPQVNIDQCILIGFGL